MKAVTAVPLTGAGPLSSGARQLDPARRTNEGLAVYTNTNILVWILGRGERGRCATSTAIGGHRGVTGPSSGVAGLARGRWR